MKAFAEVGYPTVVPDLCSPTYTGINWGANWGNDDAISAMTAAFNYLTSTVGAKTDKVCLFGESMGAATVMSWARANISKVLAIALGIPLLDVNDVYVNNRGGFQASIGNAYGVTYPTALPNLTTHSANSFSNADLAVVGSVPILIYSSDNDTIASNTSACTAWAAKVAAAGAANTPTITSMGSVGHTFLNPDNLGLVQFFDSAGGRS